MLVFALRSGARLLAPTPAISAQPGLLLSPWAHVEQAPTVAALNGHAFFGSSPTKGRLPRVQVERGTAVRKWLDAKQSDSPSRAPKHSSDEPRRFSSDKRASASRDPAVRTFTISSNEKKSTSFSKERTSSSTGTPSSPQKTSHFKPSWSEERKPRPTDRSSFKQKSTKEAFDSAPRSRSSWSNEKKVARSSSSSSSPPPPPRTKTSWSSDKKQTTESIPTQSPRTKTADLHHSPSPAGAASSTAKRPDPKASPRRQSTSFDQEWSALTEVARTLRTPQSPTSAVTATGTSTMAEHSAERATEAGIDTTALLKAMRTSRPKQRPFRMTQENPDPMDVSRSVRKKKQQQTDTSEPIEPTAPKTPKRAKKARQAAAESGGEDPHVPMPAIVDVEAVVRKIAGAGGSGANGDRWRDTCLQATVCRAVEKRLGLAKPTPVQAMAIKTILKGKDTLVHAPTGSGKTLAVLLPMLQRIAQHLPSKASAALFGTAPAPKRNKVEQEEEEENKEEGAGGEEETAELKRKQRRVQARAHGLRALVMLPTLELTKQFVSVLEELLGRDGAEESLWVANGSCGSSAEQLEQMHQSPRPILLGTPERLLEILRLDMEQYGLAGKRMTINPRTIEMVVIDEVDMVFRPLTRYAPLVKKKNHFRHPPAGTEFLRILRDFSTSQQKKLDKLEGKPAQTVPDINPPNMQVVAMSATLAQSIKHNSRRMWMRRLARTEKEKLGAKKAAAKKAAEAQQLHPYATITSAPSLLQQQQQQQTASRAHLLEPIYYVRAAGAFAAPASIQHFFAVLNDDSPKAKVAMLSEILASKPVVEGVDSCALVLFEDDGQMRRYTSMIRQIPNVTLGPLRLTTPIRIDGWTHLYLANYRQVRGLHFDNVQHVFLLDPPTNESDYLHLAGRTGRMQKDGTTIDGSVVTMASFEQLSKLRKFMTNLDIAITPLNIDFTKEPEQSCDRLQEE